MAQTFPRQHIAEKISDLRQMRGALSDLISSAIRLIAQSAGEADSIRLELVVALSAAERADMVAQERMRQLYDLPTTRADNRNEEAA